MRPWAGDEKEESRNAHEARVKAKYEKMIASEGLTGDKLKDALLHLLKCQWKHGSIPEEADIHIRRIEGREGFQS